MARRRTTLTALQALIDRDVLTAAEAQAVLTEALRSEQPVDTVLREFRPDVVPPRGLSYCFVDLVEYRSTPGGLPRPGDARPPARRPPDRVRRRRLVVAIADPRTSSRSTTSGRSPDALSVSSSPSPRRSTTRWSASVRSIATRRTSSRRRRTRTRTTNPTSSAPRTRRSSARSTRSSRRRSSSARPTSTSSRRSTTSASGSVWTACSTTSCASRGRCMPA